MKTSNKKRTKKITAKTLPASKELVLWSDGELNLIRPQNALTSTTFVGPPPSPTGLGATPSAKAPPKP